MVAGLLKYASCSLELKSSYLAAAVYTLKLKVRSTAANRVFCSKQYPPLGFCTSFSNTFSSLQLMTSFRSKAYNSAASAEVFLLCKCSSAVPTYLGVMQRQVFKRNVFDMRKLQLCKCGQARRRPLSDVDALQILYELRFRQRAHADT